MAENQLTDAAATALGGTTDPDFDTGVAYPAANADPWLIPFYQFGHQILNALAEVANNLRVFNDDAGGTTLGVTPGRCTINGVVTTYAGGTISMTDNDTTPMVHIKKLDDLAINRKCTAKIARTASVINTGE